MFFSVPVFPVFKKVQKWSTCLKMGYGLKEWNEKKHSGEWYFYFKFSVAGKNFCIMWLVSSWRVFFSIWEKWVARREVAHMDKKGTWSIGSRSIIGRDPSPPVVRFLYYILPHQNFKCQATKSIDFQKVFTMGNSGSKTLYTCNGPTTWILTSYILILCWLRVFLGFGYLPIKSKLIPLIFLTFHQVCLNFVEFFPGLKSLLKVYQILSLPNLSQLSLIMSLFFKIHSLTYFSPLHLKFQ